MANQISTAFVQQYSNTLRMLLQEKGSLLRNTVTVQTGLKGTGVSPLEQIGKVKAQKVNGRHGDTPILDTPHDKRWVAPVDYEWGDLIDDTDRLRMLVDPTSSYSQNAVYAIGRGADEEIVSGLLGDNRTGETGSAIKPFKPENIISSATGFSVAKLKDLRKILRLGGVQFEENDPVACVIGAVQEDQLLRDPEYINGDYGKAVLDNGRLKSFLGFNFVLKEDLPFKQGTTDIRIIPVYCKSGVILGEWQPITARLGERADKRFATQVYAYGTFGASRSEEAKCAYAECKE